MNNYEDNENGPPDKETKEYQEDNESFLSQDDLKKETLRSSRDICQDCLEKSFHEDHKTELTQLCKSRFPKIGRRMVDDFHIDKIIGMLLIYCESNDVFDDFWSMIKEKRQNQWERFYSEWERAIEREREDCSARFHEIQDAEIIKQQDQCVTENKKDIVSCFLNDLDESHQSLAMTAALFQGVEKSTFQELVADVQNILYDSSTQETSSDGYLDDEVGEDAVERAKSKKIYQKLEDEQKQFKIAKIKIVPSYRYKEYGRTEVDIIIFEIQGYRKQILQMLRYNISRKKQEIFYLIYKLGFDKIWEKRLCAVNAVSALSEIHPFHELVDYIIRDWANNTDQITQKFTRKSTATSLSAIIREERYEREIFKLLHSWSNKNNKKLVATRILTYSFIAEKFPEESMNAIEGTVLADPENLPVKLNDIVMKVHHSNKKVFVSYIYDWIRNESIRQLAGAWFLRFIKLNDVASFPEIQEEFAEIVFHLLKKISYRETAIKIKEWAEEALVAEENEFAIYRSLFHLLYKKCEREFDSYLQRWQKQRESDREWAVKRYGADAVLQTENQRSFFELKPVE